MDHETIQKFQEGDCAAPGVFRREMGQPELCGLS